MREQKFYQRASAFTAYVGIETRARGRSCRLQVRPCHANAMGYAHGGAIFSLADRAFSCAVNQRGKVAVAMEMKINYLSPVKVGDVLVTRTSIVKEGRSTTVCYIEVLRRKEPVAVVLATGFNCRSGDRA